MRFPIWIFAFALAANILGVNSAQGGWERIYSYNLLGPYIPDCVTQYGAVVGDYCGHFSGLDWIYNGNTRVAYQNRIAYCNNCSSRDGFYAPFLGGCTPGGTPLTDTYAGCEAVIFTQQMVVEVWIAEETEDCCPEGPCCPNKQCPNATVGNPVNFLSGAKEEEVVDLEFPTPFAQGFKIERFYNSKYSEIFAIGYGWKHNYDVAMKSILAESGLFNPSAGNLSSEHGALITINGVQQPGTQPSPKDLVSLTTESFRRQFFVSTSSAYDHYHPMNGAGGEDIAKTGDTWHWHRANGITYSFDMDYRLIAKTDGSGNTQSLTYDTEGRLSTITDEATGRVIGLHYNAANWIDHISGPATDAVPDGIWVRYQYDANGNLTRVEYADDTNSSGPSGFQYGYTDTYDTHNLTEKHNLAGELLSSWKYNRADRVVSNITRDGQGVTLDYGRDRTTVTDANGVPTIYYFETVDNRRRLTSVSGERCTSCGGGSKAVRYVYDSGKRVIEKELANGRIDRYSNFDGQNRYLTETQAVGTPEERTIHYTLHPQTGDRLSITETSVLGGGNKETIFDYDEDANDIPNQNPTRLMYRKIERGFTHDGAGAITPYQYVTTYSYTAKGQLASIDGPLAGDQDKTVYTYDTLTGDRLTETHPLTGSVSYTYDAAGNLESVTDANGVTTTMSYDGRNRALSETRNRSTTSLTYTTAGKIVTSTDTLNRTMVHQYNSAGFVEKIVDPSGNFIYYGYDTNGRRIEASCFAADNTRTYYSGTDWGNPASNPSIVSGKPWKSTRRNAADTADLATVYAYDDSGNLTAVTDANGLVTSYTYDQFDRLSSVTQPGNAVTSYAYDSQGHLISVTDAQGAITMYDYDDMGRLVETDSPDTGTTLYSYDAAGNLRYKIQIGQSTEYRYDDESRLTRILYSDPSLNATYTYDTGSGENLIGRLASITDPSGTTSYSYDADGNLVSETRTLSGTRFTTEYAYDAAGNLRQMIYPTGQTIDYVPDNIDPGRIAMVKLDTTRILAANLTYLPFGPIASMAFGNGITTAKTFGKSYQVQTISAVPVMNRSYSADNMGNITAIVDNLDVTRSQSFVYDANYRLSGATGIYGTIGYTYDAAGNRSSQTVNGLQDAYAYYPGTNRLRTITGVHPELFEYDAAGNTTRRIPGASNIQPLITDPADYTYANSGQRAKKHNSADVIYHYDPSGQLIAETTPTGSLIRAYVWLENQPLAMIGANGSVYYFHNDHLGTPQKLTDSTGAIVWSADYLPFGHADVTVDTVENNLRFSGQYYDRETGLHYNYWRYYDPKLGRYLRADPIGLAGGVNPFSFTENNPVNLIDPDGESPFFFPVAAIFAVYYVLYHHDIANAPEDPCANLYASNGATGLIGEGLFNIATVGLLSKLNWFAPKSITNPIPERMARVVPMEYANGSRLAATNASEAWVTAVDDLAGINNSRDLAQRLTLIDDAGNVILGPRAVIEFDAPASGIASPINRSMQGFVGYGKTAGGAREFIIPNLKLNVTIQRNP
jgi:RHS repeat-associated protein